jgi:2-dehydro-3-deoxyphosphogluconate aldolase/(4S)-4-hydroxy-2-oxoglutarate aldolase
MTTLDELFRIRIIPVVVIDDASKAADVAAALAAGGIGCAEITLRTSEGLASIAAISGMSDFVLGAGTVLTVDQVDRCVDAGAKFIVTPGFDDAVVTRAQQLGVAVLPGVATATEIQRALRAGLDTVKFFPADRLGGLPTITSLAGPFPDLSFVPSGGVSAANAVEYLASPSVPAVSGSWMVSREAIARGDFDMIARLSTDAVALLGGAS